MKNVSAFQFFTILVLVFSCVTINAQRKGKKQNDDALPPVLMTRPKLVVGIIVDQMRYDYITRFWNHYGKGGFKRLINNGYNCKNNHFNYAPTSTGPGHTSVYTGTTPATHGIIGNNWFDKESGKSVYCASDDSFASVGTTSDAGKMSPHRMGVTTITDELRLHTQMRGKTIAIALKDRGAVLPGGHTANGAYWFHGDNEGKWITSTYYMDKLPKWVQDFNLSKKVQEYKKPWETLKPISSYIESGSDDNLYEGFFETEKKSLFPHNTPNLLSKTTDFNIIRYTPFGNSLTADFAIAALDGEALGKDMDTDFLAVSFSSTDYVGHKFGVNSKEIEDTYLRLDKDLERLFLSLDKKVGEGEYTLFLTADHGAIEVPAYLKSRKIPSGYLTSDELMVPFNEYLKFTFGTTDVVRNFSNSQFFLDHKILKNLDIKPEDAQDMIAAELINYNDVEKVYTAHQMWKNNYTKGLPYVIQNGYNQKRSGDVFIVTKPGFINYAHTGSTHGSPQIYDTHVPLLFFGKGIKKGSTTQRTEIPDVAPTIAALLGVSFPNGTTGSVIPEVLK